MEVAAESRTVLRRYHPLVLKALILIAAIASVGEYFAYTLTSKMGERFPQMRGRSYTIITADEDFERHFGRKADKRRKLYNGMIKCQFYMYFK